MKKQFIKDLKANESVEDTFVVISKEAPRRYKDNRPALWFSIVVSDKTGHIPVKFWGKDEEQTNALHLSLKAQNVVFIKGQVKDDPTYGPEIMVDPITGKLEKTDNYDKEDYVATTEKNIEEMKSHLKKIISTIKNQDIKRVLNSFFEDEVFMEKFSKSPAASHRHHNVIGGLLEHVLNLIKISKNIVEIYPTLDEDLLIAGCIFHDIGKIKELEVNVGISYSTEGNLLGHISIGYQMVADKIDALDGFPASLRNKILHIILSHHGKGEWGSPIEPKFLEAIAFHQIDNCDAQIKGALQEKAITNSED